MPPYSSDSISIAFDPLRTFCWRHSLQARLTAVFLREEEGRASPSPFSFSSSLEAERLKPREVVGVNEANGCCEPPWVGDESIAGAMVVSTSAWPMSQVPSVRRLGRSGGGGLAGVRSRSFSSALVCLGDSRLSNELSELGVPVGNQNMHAGLRSFMRRTALSSA